MESNASLKGNPSSSRDPYPQNGFNLLLKEGWKNRKDGMSEGFSLNLSCYTNSSSSIYDDSNNVRESNTSNLPFELDTSSRKGTIVIDEEESDELLQLFPPQTPRKGLLLADRSHKGRDENGKQLVGSQDLEAPIIKGRWTLEEDRKLIKMVSKFGEGKWAVIARFVGTRLGKQCRERWENHLRHHLKTEDWTEQEKLDIIQAHKEVGCRWAELGRRFPRRSQNSIKNLWNGTKRRLQNALQKGRLNADLNPLEAYILTFINNNNIMTSSPTPTPTLTAVVDNSNNEAPAAVPVNSDAVDSQMMMMIDLNTPVELVWERYRSSHQFTIQSNSSNRETEDSGADNQIQHVYHPAPAPAPAPVFADDEHLSLGSNLNDNNDKVVGPDQLGMSEEIDWHKETGFMELLLNSY